jgi:itaconyl-CoA hydratase
MVHGEIEVEENRYRETYGRYYEELEEGAVYEHRPGRTITQTDAYWFSLLMTNMHGLHFDEGWGQKTDFGQCPAPGTMTFGMVSGMSMSDISYKAVATIGYEELSLPNPVFPGDTITAESEVLNKRLSESREGDGIVTVHTRGHNQDGDLVCEFKRVVLLPTKEKGFIEGY